MQNSHHLPPIPRSDLPTVPQHNNLYIPASKQVFPSQVAQPQAYTEPNTGALAVTGGGAAASATTSNHVVVAIVVSVILIAGGVTTGIVIVITNNQVRTDEIITSCSGYSCLTGECIPSSFACDGVSNCPQGEDETEGCSSTTTTTTVLGSNTASMSSTSMSSSATASPNLQYILELDDDLRQEWTDAHNYYRRLVSSPEAANMRLVTWDAGLEDLAKEVVSTCDFTHTSVENLTTSFFPEVGENLYSGNLFTGLEIPSQDGVTKAWYDEVAYYNYDNRSCQSGEMCGHYTQVVWANSYKVGCAIAKCSAINGGTTPYIVSCNYGPSGNIFDYSTPRPPYISGDFCSQCGDGDVCDDQLCTNSERDLPITIATTVTSALTTTPETIGLFTCIGDSSQIDNTKVCDGTEDCIGGTDEDRCIIAMNGYQDGDVRVYSVSTGSYYKLCGFADGWTTAKSDALCSHLGVNSSTSTTEIVSSDPGVKSFGDSFVLNDVVQSTPETCTDNKVVKITCATPSSCGVTSRIVGGMDANVLDHPWQVALLETTSKGTFPFCGGTIVSPQWIVSAAHCIDSKTSIDFPNLDVLVGRTTLAIDPPKIYDIDNIVYHPLYSNDTNFMDIAVIKVSSSITFTTEIRSACLPAPGEVFSDLSQVDATGFGATSEGGSSSNTLQEVTVNLYNKDTCSSTFQGMQGRLYDGMICAGVPEGGKDSCQGDSGGPLIIQSNSLNYLIGATSWGIGCARPGFPGVYAEISYIADWIRREIVKGS